MRGVALMDTVKKKGPSCQNLHGRHSRHAQVRDRRMRSFRLPLRTKKRISGDGNTQQSKILSNRLPDSRITQALRENYALGSRTLFIQSGALRDRAADCASRSSILLNDKLSRGATPTH